ncbi:Mitochondrial carrier domain [Phytophthora cactorum]|nr:Mitochondrial carrier domain [Phytophthora cactorum]
MTSSAALRHISPLKVRSLPSREAASTSKTMQSPTAIPLHLKLAVGGMAGAVGMVATFPMDIVKTHLQGQTRTGGRMMFSGPVQCFKHIVGTDGLRGLYRGLPPTLMGVLPEKAIKLAVNEQLREHFADADGTCRWASKLWPVQAPDVRSPSSLTRYESFYHVLVILDLFFLTETLNFVQVEIVKIRLQMQTSLPVAERQTALEIARSLGIRGVYKGAGVCFMRDVPYAVLFFPSYATLRDAWTDKATGKNSVLSIVTAGAVAGAGAAAICTPADVIKTRLQMKGSPYTGMVDCVRKIVSANGPTALMKGAGPLSDSINSQQNDQGVCCSHAAGHPVRASAVKPVTAISQSSTFLKQATTRIASSVVGPVANNTAASYKPGKWDIFMLGITIVIGGQYFCWNAGISAGLWSFFIAYLLIGSAYIALCCCTAEITGALPFAGGAYGLARCTLGFYPAFMIGCCEALEYIAYVSTSTIAFVDLVLDTAPEVKPLRPLLCGLFYLSALVFHIKGGRAFWIFNLVLGIISLLIVLLYCIGSLPFVSFAKYAADQDLEFVDGFQGFMKALPLAAWFFVGVEALPMASDQVEQAKHIVPIAQVGCVVTLFVTGIFVYFVTASLPPGLSSLPTELVPFNNGFTLLLDIPRHTATILSLPATYATAFGFMWCYGQLIVAMATSKLLPSFLNKTTIQHETPYAALIAGTSVSYALCLVVYWVPSIWQYLFNMCMLAGFMSYTGQCIGYISLKRNYRNIKSSEFRSPFGSWGALYSMLVWVLSIVGIVAFQGNGSVETFVFLTVVALLTAFYFVYARKRQTFSPQENRVMLVAHVTKFNIKKVAAARRHKNQSTSATNSSHHTEAPEGKRSKQIEAIGKSIKSIRSIRSDKETLRTAPGPSAGHAIKSKYRHGKLDIYMLGITIVIGGQYFCWNEGINAGFYSFLIGYFLIASAYITFCCCTAEITGALPFAGGSYGLARCTLGFYPAFMIGCCEALEYIAYVSTSTISFVDLIVDAVPSLGSLSPLLWTFFYASALLIQLKGGREFWIFNLSIGVVSLVIAVIYCLGSFAFVNFGKYGADPNFEFVGGFPGFMKALPLAGWFFVGVEALNLSSDQVEQPKKIVPIAQVSCVITLFCSGLVVYFVTVSLPQVWLRYK